MYVCLLGCIVYIGCACVCTHQFVHMWRPGINIKCPLSRSTLFPEMAPSLNLELTDWLDWLIIQFLLFLPAVLGSQVYTPCLAFYVDAAGLSHACIASTLSHQDIKDKTSKLLSSVYSIGCPRAPCIRAGHIVSLGLVIVPRSVPLPCRLNNESVVFHCGFSLQFSSG